LLFVVILFFSNSASADDKDKERGIWNTVKNDYQQFYSSNHLMRMGIAFGGGAVMANTSIDENYQTWYQSHVRNSKTDEFAKVMKVFGEGIYFIPLSLIAASTEYYFNSDEEASVITNWGKRTARAYVLGGPAMLSMQRITGASRPYETEDASRWKPFNDSNGVSGHAFIGAVPFLTIAHMNEESPLIKYLFYAVSGLTAWSRINDNAHFASQAALGWYMAWEATDAILDREKEDSKLTIIPLISHDRYGVCIGLKW
jgi:hypothetical protein